MVSSHPDRFSSFYPTAAEPEFVPTEPSITPDDQILVDELRRRGHQVAAVVWGCLVEDLRNQFDLLVVRSTWDYMDSAESRRQFLTWLSALEQAGVVVENNPRIMLWLMDKKYLLDFASVGVPIVPTHVVGAGESLSLVEHFDRHGPLIVKPAVSAGGAGLILLQSRDEASAFQDEFVTRCRTGSQLVQPFLPEICDRGEWSLVYLDGRYSHAVHKLPAAGNILVQAEQGGSLRFDDPPSAARTLTDLVVDRCHAAISKTRPNAKLLQDAFPPLYLRIDVIETAAGTVLSECEGVEPELFFRARPGSEQLCCEAIERKFGNAAE
jgi:hypothetical protein